MKIRFLLTAIFIFCYSCKTVEIEKQIFNPEIPVKTDAADVADNKAVIIPPVLISADLDFLYFTEQNSVTVDVLQPSVGMDILPVDPILKLIELKRKFFKYNEIAESEFDGNEVTSIYSDDTHYYIGTIRGGIFRYSLSGDNSQVIQMPVNSIVNRAVTAIEKIDNQIVITSFSGLYIYFPDTGKLLYLSDGKDDKTFLSMCRVQDSLYIGSSGGSIYKMEINGVLEEIVNIKNSPIKTLEYFDESLFIGTSGEGLYEYSIDENKISSVDPVNQYLQFGKINFISFFNDLYWISAAEEGLIIISSNFAPDSIIKKEGWYYASCQSENYIYFGTHRDGLMFYDKIDDKWFSWGLKNGLSSLYIPSLHTERGNLFLSTPDKGIIIINEQIHEQKL